MIERFLITGARSWESPAAIRAVLRKLLETRRADRLLLIVGGAPGVDTIAANEAAALGIHVAVVPALWQPYGRSAGPRRNRIMLSLEPQFVVAFHWDLDSSKGTADCVRAARALDIPVKVVLRTRRQAMPSVDDWYRAKERKAAAKRSKR
jgi:hypothetical protein